MTRARTCLGLAVALCWLTVACDQDQATDGGITAPLLKKGGGGRPPAPPNIDITVTPEVRAGTPNQFSDDGLGSYPGGVCGVKAYAGTDLSFRPVDNRLKGKAIRELEDPDGPCAGIYPRSASFDMNAALVHEICVNPVDEANCPTDFNVHTGEQTLAQHVLENDLDDPGPASSLGTAQLRFFDADTTNSSLVPGGFNVAYCSGGESNRPFRFSPERHPENSNYFMVTEQGGVTSVVTQQYPDNMGTCLRERQDGTVVIILVHMDLAYEYVEIP